MKDIERYDVVDGRFGTTPYFKDEQGMFVKYSEHKEIVDRLQTEIDVIRKVTNLVSDKQLDDAYTFSKWEKQ